LSYRADKQTNKQTNKNTESQTDADDRITHATTVVVSNKFSVMLSILRTCKTEIK